YANIDKHHRLDSLPSPKIVFIGGSNLGFGLDSKRIEDSLHMPVVNMGLHAGLGLKFMIDEVKSSVKKGDVVVLSPEYHHFFGNNLLDGEKVLVALLFDVNRKDLKYITFSQAIHLIPFTVGYSVSKLMRKEMDVMDENVNNEFEKNYKRNSFNKYGDEVMHWNYPNQSIHQMAGTTASESISLSTLDLIRNFDHSLSSRGARLIVIPPAFMHSSFIGYANVIDKIETGLKEQHTPFAIKPASFAFPDSLFFNTVYHLNRQGVEERTDSIIQLMKHKIYK
ncbi:MAG TPA: hypothetical protein VJ602_05175, partial [Paludibacter sp.]|nr:hypothetical protein [Paludibacter sp.]